MRQIKFRAWDLDRKEFLSAGEIYIQVNAIQKGPHKLRLETLSSCDHADRFVLQQFTGLKDKNGVDIYENDLLNVAYTSFNKEHIHDCIYKVLPFNGQGLYLSFVKLLWESRGHNQNPINQTLSFYYDTLEVTGGSLKQLVIPDTFGGNHLSGNKWKEMDKSDYFKIIGNIYENPELLA